MKLKRDELATHLTRIACNGQINEAVFHGAFGVSAVTPDHLLCVLGAELEDVEALPEDVGVADLGMLIKALSMVPGAEDDVGVDVRLEGKRLVIDEPGRGCVRLLTAAPRTIATRVEAASVEKLMAKVGSTVIPLTPGLVEGVRNTFRGLKATETELVVGPEGGMIRVGDQTSHIAEFPSVDLCAPEPYSLNFGDHLIDVLTTVGADAMLYLSGPDSNIAVTDEAYTYLLAPRRYGAEKKATKAKGKGKAAPAAAPAPEAAAEPVTA